MLEKQLEAFAKFQKLKVGALFMKMGTGKTKIAIDLVNYNNIDLLIYVAPFSALKNIKTEIEKWNLNCEYLLIGYETIQASDKKYLEILQSVKNKKCFIVADESIFIKNEETKRFKRLCKIREYCNYAIILNGTPLTKNEWDIYNQMHFLSPLILNMNRNQFLNTFFKVVRYKKKGHSEKSFHKFSEVNADILYKLIEPYIFQCDLDFNFSETTNINWINYTEKSYYIEKDEKLKNLQTFSINAIINLLTTLNVVASNSVEKNNKVVEYIKNKQVIVFCNFLSEAEYIKNNTDCYIITGSTKNRSEILENFKNDNKPLIMTYGVGSYSLNLQFCNEIVYSSINFDFGKYEQSKYRIKRIGQNKDIKYTFFLADLGINKFIFENLDKKQDLGDIIKQKFENGGIDKWIKEI